jgi:hypothetical protein
MSRRQPTIQRASAMALVLTIAGLLFAFGFIAQEVVKGKTAAGMQRMSARSGALE